MLPLLLLLLVPNALATGHGGFIVTPASKNATVGATVHFTCQHTSGDVLWRINGTRVDRYSAASTKSKAGLHTLTINNAPAEYDKAKIQCMVNHGDQVRVSVLTRPVILRLQERLAPVRDIRVSRNASTLFWTPPFSLDLTDIDPDIAYCVDIYNVTCGKRKLIISDCNVTEPRYTFDAPDGYIYEYIITPRSNVEGARNGTPSQPLNERFSRFSSERNSVSTRNVQLAFLNLEPNRPVPSSYTVILESLDGLEDVELKTTNITTEGDVVVVDVDDRLPLNRVWNCTLLAYGCRQNAVLSNVELSTHDIQNISVSSRIPSQVRVTGEFIQESMATGVLVTIVNATNLEHHLISRDSRNGIDGVISGLSGSQYTVSVFVVSEDGLPFERVATKPRRITVENAAGPVGDRPSPAIEYTLNQTPDGVCITCTFPVDSSATGCVAVVHQRISQLSSSGLMNIKSSYKFTRSGDTAYGCSDSEVNSEDYEFRVIGGQLNAHVIPQTSSSICTSTVSCIIGSVFAIIASLAILTLVVLLVLLKLKKIRCCGKASLPSETLKYSKKHDIEGRSSSSSRAVPNPYAEMPPSNKVGDTPEETLTGSSDPGETNDPQVASPSDSPPVPVVPQAASSESAENVPAAEAEVTKDYSPNPGNKPQYATLHEELKFPQDEVKEETQPIDIHYPSEESASDSTNLDTTVTEYDSQPKPVAQSTPISGASEYASDQSPIDGNSLLVQSSRMYKYTADRKVSKNSMTFLKGLNDSDEGDSKYYIPQPVFSKDEPHKDDSAYNTCSMPGDLSASSEPYSEISNNAESGCETNLVIKTKEINEIVCSSGKPPGSVLMSTYEDHGGGETVSHHPEDVQPMMGNHEQQQLGMFNANEEDDAGPLVPSPYGSRNIS